MAKQKATTEEPLEKQLWKTADKLRKNIDAAEYKHIVLGLIFLKYISDAFEELYATLKAEEASGADPEDKDEYKAENVFFVPQDARWSYLQSKAKQPEIGKFVDEAHKDLKADYIIANPPFNVSDWGGDLMRTDGRWQYGTPPADTLAYPTMKTTSILPNALPA